MPMAERSSRRKRICSPQPSVASTRRMVRRGYHRAPRSRGSGSVPEAPNEEASDARRGFLGSWVAYTEDSSRCCPGKYATHQRNRCSVVDEPCAAGPRRRLTVPRFTRVNRGAKKCKPARHESSGSRRVQSQVGRRFATLHRFGIPELVVADERGEGLRRCALKGCFAALDVVPADADQYDFAYPRQRLVVSCESFDDAPFYRLFELR